MCSREISKIYDQHISPSDNFFSVGPSESPLIDPSLLKIASLSHKGQGFVIAPPTGRGSMNNADRYLSIIEKFRNAGLPMAPVTLLNAQSVATNTGLKSDSIKIITDHSTSTFIVGDEKSDKIVDLLTSIYSEYYRVLSIGGVALIQAHFGGNYCTNEMVEGSLSRTGFNIERESVLDVFRIPITMAILGRLQEQQSKSDIQYLLKHVTKSSNITEMMIPVESTLDLAIYPSPHCYICHK